MKMIQFNRVHVYRFMIPKTGFVWSKLSRFFYRRPLAGVDEKTGQVLVQVSEKYFRPTEVQFVTQLPMSDEGVMILGKSYPKEQVLVLNALEMSYTDDFRLTFNS